MQRIGRRVARSCVTGNNFFSFFVVESMRKLSKVENSSGQLSNISGVRYPREII